jgi:hypothetical protein
MSRHFVTLTNDILRLLVSSQPLEDRLTKLVIVRPLGKLDPGHQYRLDPLAALHVRQRNPKVQSDYPPLLGDRCAIAYTTSARIP